MEGEADLGGRASVGALRTLLGDKEGGAGPGTRGRQGGASRPSQHAPERLLAVPAGRRGAFDPASGTFPTSQTAEAGGTWPRRITSLHMVTMMGSSNVSPRKVASSSTDTRTPRR